MLTSNGSHTSDNVGAAGSSCGFTLTTALPFARAGSVRALAMISALRSSLLPDVPTMGEATGTDLEADIVTGLLVPFGTPPDIIELLHRTIAAIIAPLEFKTRLLGLGFEPVASTPAHFAQWIATEVGKWAKVIRDGNITAQ